MTHLSFLGWDVYSKALVLRWFTYCLPIPLDHCTYLLSKVRAIIKTMLLPIVMMFITPSRGFCDKRISSNKMIAMAKLPLGTVLC